MIYENVAEDANIIFGAVVDEKLKDQVYKHIWASFCLPSICCRKRDGSIDATRHATPTPTHLCPPSLAPRSPQVSITVLATGFSLNPTAAEGDNLDDLLTTLDQQLSAPRPKVRPHSTYA